MKRYRVLVADFDTRATILTIPASGLAQTINREPWKAAQEGIRDGLRQDYGVANYEAKERNFIELGPLPFSILAFHNAFLRQARDAFVIGAYYPALTGACALGERILNHLIRLLRDDYKCTPEYKRVYRKESFDDWETVISTLSAWGVLLPQVAEDFRKLKETRNGAIHFRPEVDADARTIALRALRELSAVIEGQFANIGPQPWFISGVDGCSFIKKENETTPFVAKVYLPYCSLVGPRHLLEHIEGRWIVKDEHQYETKEVSDEEYAELFKSRSAPRPGRDPQAGRADDRRG